MNEAVFRLKDELDEFGTNNTMITVRRADLEAAVNELFFKGDEWSNNAALGYIIKSAQDIGLQESTIHQLVGAMHRNFDEKTLDEASNIYNKSSF